MGTKHCQTIRRRIRRGFIIIIIIILALGTYNPEGDEKLKSKYKIGYDHQSVQSVAGKLIIIIILCP